MKTTGLQLAVDRANPLNACPGEDRLGILPTKAWGDLRMSPALPPFPQEKPTSSVKGAVKSRLVV